MSIKSLQFGSLSPTLTPSKYASESVIVDSSDILTPVTITQVKPFLPVYDSNSDLVIQGIIDAVTKQIERFINRDTTERQRISLWNFPEREIMLPYGPHKTIVVEQYFNGDWHEIEAGNLLILGLDRKRIQLHYAYPTRVTCTSGFVECPADIMQAILQETAFQYKNRNDPNEVQAETKFGLSVATLNLISSYR